MQQCQTCFFMANSTYWERICSTAQIDANFCKWQFLLSRLLWCIVNLELCNTENHAKPNRLQKSSISDGMQICCFSWRDHLYWEAIKAVSWVIYCLGSQEPWNLVQALTRTMGLSGKQLYLWGLWFLQAEKGWQYLLQTCCKEKPEKVMFPS